MTAQELKNSILQLAVQGKLVPQDKNDEPTSELLKRVQAEKARLIKECKIKKEKALPPIVEEELPFDIPGSWEWLKLGQLCQLGEGQKIQDKKYPYLEAKYLRGKIEATILTNGEFVKKGTRLILVDGENSGEVFLATEDGYKGSTFKVLYIPEEMYIPYVLMFILLNKQLLRNRKTGSAIPHLNKELFFNLLIPIPPLAEQKRIVEKIEELLPLVEEYGKAETRLKELNADFPDMLRKSILQQAVQGKLTERNPEDEPASELLKRILAEKAKLIKEGKIKKEKALPPITEEELPFDIPQSWEWLKLGQLCQLGKGEKMQDKKYPYLEAKYLRGKIEATILTNGEFVKKGTRLILVDGENSGEVFLATEDGYKGSTFKVLYIPEEMYIPYVLMFILLNKQLLRNRKTGSAIPHLNKELFFNLLIPIPPLEEQKRIVARVEELLALCDQLK